LPRIFDLFTQIGRASEPDQKGLGVGLCMVRSLVDMHGGAVTAHSAGQGAGAELVVRLPLPYQDEAGQDAESGRADAVPLAGQRILVVDDNRDAADTLALPVEGFGAEVRVAYDGSSALAMLKRFDAQNVLLDRAPDKPG
jgi:two-component system CheB/CheR fusion protein